MSPVPVNDYPRTWSEFLEWFSSEEACVAYLERLRWPQGFVCPSCGGMTPPYRASRVRLLCKDCGHQSTITAGQGLRIQDPFGEQVFDLNVRIRLPHKYVL